MFRSALLPILMLGAALAAPAADAPVQATAKQSGRTLTLKPGATLEVRLAAQLGTGYSWQATAPDAAVLVQEGEPATEPQKPGGPQLVGGPEIQLFRFTAKGPGKADLKFAYARGFEPGKKPVRTATFHIKVVEAAK